MRIQFEISNQINVDLALAAENSGENSRNILFWEKFDFHSSLDKIGQLRIGAIGAVVVVFGALVLLVANNGARSRLTYSQNTIVKPLLQTI